MSVRDMLDKRSVEFGMPSRGSLQASWPFFAGFVPYPYRYDTSAGDHPVSAADAIGPDGILIPAGGAPVDFYVPLPRNAPFMLERITYSAHRENAEGGSDGSRGYLAGQGDLYSVPGASSQYTAQGFQYRSYNEFIRVSVWLDSAGGRDYMGAEQYTSVSGEFMEVPITVSALQSKDDGPSTVTMRALLAGNTVLRFRARNIANFDLRLNGNAFGYQIQSQGGAA